LFLIKNYLVNELLIYIIDLLKYGIPYRHINNNNNNNLPHWNTILDVVYFT